MSDAVASTQSKYPLVAVIMGSQSDAPTMQGAWEALEEFKIPYEKRVVSAHRTPEDMFEFAKAAESRGVQVIIAGAGGAAHLPGMVASLTTLPVIGVPISTTELKGVDALHSIVQMPAGIPVACVAIGNSRNAALLAVEILALQDKSLAEALKKFRAALKDKVKQMKV